MPEGIHQSHPTIVKRLKRAQGHLTAVLAMFDAHRPCVDLAQQLHAVESAISSAKRELIHDHIEHCITDTAEGGGSSLSELKQLAKYL
ncbi:nickel-resistant pritein NirB [Mesorhizobium sp. LNJC384A00]|uniref:metal-sensing transcriptional repressor n=1 Tax=Mesorhizobium sp. LNJC384A00 TaxID=1287268 RepID=UPI0003CF4D07|nr:metal-sensing transcriptional repressor [Mesorhizobium sp. LNJC384A00]ESY44683.1 nickel-resistant pritein NirB [Mesorhizobium sp. LNJC384A00]